ncbi:MAG: helix-turn-helix transcriptional regulator [Oligoflexia bacterium]|nr:helix-turn-helix transcriptional regulator [Oligoflexia bacterium]
MSTKIKYGTKEMDKDFGPLTFGSLLKNYRDNEEFSQKDFAQKLKISPQRLNDFEKGRRLPDIESAVKFAKILQDSEAFFIQILFQDYLSSKKLKLDVKVTKKIAA